jgi:hypothetical protein
MNVRAVIVLDRRKIYLPHNYKTPGKRVRLDNLHESVKCNMNGKGTEKYKVSKGINKYDSRYR